jgi:hypothetical protein
MFDISIGIKKYEFLKHNVPLRLLKSFFKRVEISFTFNEK